ncbi:MAG: sugar transferase [Balneolaceae bacterium]
MIKRLFDFIVALLGLLINSPIVLFLTLFVKIKMGSPFLFSQLRPGKDGVPFKMYKFRSMTEEKDENGNLLPNDKRLTSFGKFLRSTSLDELPELLNVLRGDMSLVGPRPLRMHYLERYNSFQMRRHEVRPGITGWAQINGRNSQTWDERFEMDVWYVDNQSLLLDIKILILTIFKVFRREGVTPEEENFMPEFMGTESRND